MQYEIHLTDGSAEGIMSSLPSSWFYCIEGFSERSDIGDCIFIGSTRDCVYMGGSPVPREMGNP